MCVSASIGSKIGLHRPAVLYYCCSASPFRFRPPYLPVTTAMLSSCSCCWSPLRYLTVDRSVSPAVLLLLLIFLLICVVPCLILSCVAPRAELSAKNRQLQQLELKVEEYKDSLLKVQYCVAMALLPMRGFVSAHIPYPIFLSSAPHVDDRSRYSVPSIVS